MKAHSGIKSRLALHIHSLYAVEETDTKFTFTSIITIYKTIV